MRVSRLLAAAVLFAAAAAVATPSLAARVGRPAPAFTLVTLGHQKVSLADLKGKVIVLNFWATWCLPCKLELVAMDNYAHRHPNEGLAIFAIKTDNYPGSRLLELEKLLPFPVVEEFRSWDYGKIGGAVPSSWVIDRSGILRLEQAGAFSEDSLETTISPLLAEPQPQPPPARLASRT